MAKDHRPSMQFYPGDWMKDPALRLCGPSARGAWMDILCLMFESSERGVLITEGGRVWGNGDICSAISGNPQVVSRAVRQLIANGVIKQRDCDGAYYSARMVRDEEIRRKRIQAGSKGGRPRRKSKTKAKRKQNLTPSSSSSTSVTNLCPTSKGLRTADAVQAPPGGPVSGEREERKSRPRDLIWDVIAELFYPSGVARGQCTYVGQIVRDLKEKGATPEDIRARHARYTQAWPGVTCTARALRDNWDQFSGNRKLQRVVQAPKGMT